MALQDILHTITQEADAAMLEAESQHRSRLESLKTEHKRAIVRDVQEIEDQCEKKKEHLRERASAHIAMQRRLRVLERKQEWMEKISVLLLEKLTTLPAEKLEAVLSELLKKIHEKGTIFPASQHAALLKKIAPKEQFTVAEPIDAKGGFICKTERKIYQCTFEFLIEQALLPRMEITMTEKLF